MVISCIELHTFKLYIKILNYIVYVIYKLQSINTIRLNNCTILH